MLLFDLNYYLIVSISILLFSISKSGFSGGGLALISVMILSINYGPLTALSILLPMLLVSDAIAGYINRKHFDKTIIFGLLPYTLIGVILGFILFKIIDLNMIGIFIGILALSYVLFNFLITKLIINKAPFHGSKSFWGILCGFASFSLHSGGLPLNTYLISMYNKKNEFVATLVFTMAFVNLFKIIPYFYLEIISLKDFLRYLYFSPIAVVGVLLGNWMNNKLSDKYFFYTINLFIVIASLKLVYEGLINL